ncbi:glycosyltransferase family 4 protein [Microbacterium lushaniae]|uniref:Glycosyltransferase family 4 protein n=1 Tax=Microbacterium lushaniae TaxID=2614639 RepID=A0A5J6L109_9MICO|nr:glycosyltransferase family 1 protein [Microbacterium lushaniae]QEW02157.1 glycosyltransferase family 4 protein [Microbacterium lushaniae]
MSSQPHVLVSARVLDRQVGGNTRYARSVYERIADFGIRYTLARPPRFSDSGRFRSVAYAGLEGVVWPISPPAEATVAHFPADTGAVLRGRLPIVGTIHGLATLHLGGVRNSAADRLWRERVRRLAKVSDKIITVSHSSADDIAFFEPTTAGRISVIHHGIDHDKFHPRPAGDPASLRRRLGLPERYFLYVGNLDPRKNLLALTDASQTVFKETGVPLVVAGAPAWGSRDIMQAVRGTRGVQYLGRVSEADLLPLMQGATAFCFPSSYEGFGFPVLEAMASGTPVICSGRGSLSEVAGDAARILNGIDATSIAEAMIELAQDEKARSELRARGIVNAERFDWQLSARAHADVFRQVSR